MSKGHILIVDDDPQCREFLSVILNTKHHRVTEAEDASRALEIINRTDDIDLVILDYQMPGMTGGELARKLRSNPKTQDLFILAVTGAKSKGAQEVPFLGVADDYIRKPVDAAVLLAHVDALLRRAAAGHKPQYLLERGGIRLEVSTRKVTVGSSPVRLTAGEFDLLHALMRREGRVQTRQALMDVFHNVKSPTSGPDVGKAIERLRRKLGSAGKKHIVTHHKVGYSFTA